jgi:Na+-transporting NADH:ubiquinone oxidoreductase subunit A
MQVRTGKGLNFKPDATPGEAITDSRSSRTSTFLGRDYPGTRFHLLADEGVAVKAGEPVLCDRRRPEILLTSPVSGIVTAVHRGARRRMVSVEITSDGKDDAVSFDIPTTLDHDHIQSLMMQSGLWAALRSRPFGYIPNPDRSPKALLVTAINTQPLAPASAVVISRYIKELSLGIKVLCDLVDSPVFVCKSVGDEVDLVGSHRANVVEFDGPHPAGLVGRHIHKLCPIGFDGGEVWHIDYQDVISLGHLINTARPWFERVISLAGSAVKNPRLITVPLGAAIADITVQELVQGSSRIISGSLFSGHDAVGHEACLGQRDYQVTAIIEAASTQPPGRINSLFNSAVGFHSYPLIPTTDLDKVAPPGILAVPLLRALLVGDVERARDLGALELVEEDLALLTYTCASKIDYGLLLRDMLDQIDKEGLSIRR